MAPDLRFILSEREVPEDLQVRLSTLGVRTLGLFCSIVDSKADLRATLIADFGLNHAEADITREVAMERRINTARLVDSWETASKRLSESDRVAAEQKASRLPLTLSKSHHITLRQRFEQDFGRVPDKAWPCQALVEKRFEEVEEGEVRADPLSDIVSTEEVTEDVIGAIMDRDGAIRMKKAPRTIPLPSGSEELRNRIKILGITFQLAAYRHSSRPWLATTSPDIWRDHADYVLGDDIGGFCVSSASGEVRPPWQVVLGYEFQVRKTACRLIMFDGLDIAAAMRAARKDMETKEKHFSTPTALAATRGVKRPADGMGGATSSDWAPAAKKKGSSKGGKGQGKGSSKGGDKSGGKGKSSFKNTKTPDGRMICFRYQDDSCKSKKCNFVHLCTTCLGEHPLSQCSKAAM